ncbi:MAG TPA: hypothetical protein VHD60_00105 [Candidatus Saccharimonadales bacterium]|nr:hypothetical protein [Candidatus Saccharimonadales bacterium]
MSNPDRYREAINRTSVWEHDHTILNSGLHSYDKAHMERLAGYFNEYALVMSGVKDVLRERRARVVVGMPNGMPDLLRPMVYRPDFLTVQATKVASRKFDVMYTDVPVVRSAETICVIEDVVTTGGTPAAMADTLLAINPDIELHLLTILQRGELDPAHLARFASFTALAVDLRPAWDKQDCPNEECREAA